jgi:HAD superfamily hydrolase (TIGR01549 family)
MKLKNVKAVMFDCDGVMFDTARANRIYYSHILRHFGRPAVTDEQFAFVHMHTLAESMSYLFSDEATLAAAHEFRKSMNYQHYLGYFKIEPHLVPLLQKLRPQMKTAIATNRTDTMDRLLAEFKIDGYFDLVITSSDVLRPKPHPDALLKILEYFDLAPFQAIYIGDSRLDEMAAQTAAIRLVAFRNPELSSDYHIDSLKELERLLNL